MHVPVLLNETIDLLSIESGDCTVDATLGGGGLSKELCERYGDSIRIIGLDIDEDAVRRAKDRLQGSGCNFQFEVANFSDIEKLLKRLGYDEVDKVSFDLGLSSFQLEDSGRGFSFQKDEPLRMTFSKEGDYEGITAGEIVNSWSEDVLKTIIRGYGEERFAGRISKAIVERRQEKPIESTSELVDIVESSVPRSYLRRRLHPATKTFQALRIAVNDEINALERGLKGAFEKLTPGGRVSVISFHGLEDVVVKRFFRSKENEGLAKRVNKKPVRPSREEVLSNPRSRSAKLRVLEKV